MLAYNAYAYCANNPVNYSDPTGEFLLSALIVGAIVGAAIGFAATAYVDYKDDGQVFNGSVDAKSYVANTLVGGVIGGFTGGVGSSTFSVAIPTLQTVMTTTGEVALVAGTTTVTVSGAGLVAGIGIGVVLFSKPDSGRIRFSDGTGIDPQTNQPVKNEKRANDIYKEIKDPVKKANWKKWMKGKGWRQSHLK